MTAAFDTYEGFAFCAHEASRAPIGAGGLPKWPQSLITWRVAEKLPQFAIDAYRSAIAEAFSRWASVCGIRPREAAPNEVANIEFRLVSETPGGKLAQCYLPYAGISPQATLRCEVDSAEGAAWCVSDNPPANRLDLVRVLCHELGHGLGMSHLDGSCLMAPFYSTRIGYPQAGDAAEAVARYGLPIPQQQPSIPTTPEGEAELLRVLSRGGKVVVRFSDGREVTA